MSKALRSQVQIRISRNKPVEPQSTVIGLLYCTILGQVGKLQPTIILLLLSSEIVSLIV